MSRERSLWTAQVHCLLALNDPGDGSHFGLKWSGEDAQAVIIDDVDTRAVNAIIWWLEFQQLHRLPALPWISGGYDPRLKWPKHESAIPRPVRHGCDTSQRADQCGAPALSSVYSERTSPQGTVCRKDVEWLTVILSASRHASSSPV